MWDARCGVHALLVSMVSFCNGSQASFVRKGNVSKSCMGRRSIGLHDDSLPPFLL
jgi:hypothetical protein